jgi:hypothetical protein
VDEIGASVRIEVGCLHLRAVGAAPVTRVPSVRGDASCTVTGPVNVSAAKSAIASVPPAIRLLRQLLARSQAPLLALAQAPEPAGSSIWTDTVSCARSIRWLVEQVARCANEQPRPCLVVSVKI